MKKSRIKTLISILLIVIIFYFLNNSGYLDSIFEIKKQVFLSLLALALLSFFISGFQMGFMLKEQEKISITTTDNEPFWLYNSHKWQHDLFHIFLKKKV